MVNKNNNYPSQTLQENIGGIGILNNNQQLTNSNNFEHYGINGIFGVPTRLSGLVSLSIQFIVLVLSCLLIGILFVNVGGYKYFNNNSNELINNNEAVKIVGNEPFLILKSVNDTEEQNEFLLKEDDEEKELLSNLNITENNLNNLKNVWLTNITEDNESSFLIKNENNINENKTNINEDINLQENQTFNLNELEIIGNDILNSNKSEEEENEEIEATSNILLNNSTEEENLLKNNKTNNLTNKQNEGIIKTFFEQIKPIQITFKRAKLDLLLMVRALCAIYAFTCILWFLSLIGLLISLKLEIVDLVYLNTFMLANITLLLFINVIAVGVIIALQTEYHWKMLITIGVIEGGLILCFIFNILAIVFIVIWYRYIDYMNGDDKSCLCFSTIIGCIKGRANNNRQQQKQQFKRQNPPEANYTIPEATRHSQLPYIDDSPPIQQFSNF